MRYIYYAALIGVAIFFAYLIGVYVGNMKCDVRIANANANEMIFNTKQMGNINETVFHTSVGDIRRILHEKYTIAE